MIKAGMGITAKSKVSDREVETKQEQVNNTVNIETGGNGRHDKDELSDGEKWQVAKIVWFILVGSGGLMGIGAWITYILMTYHLA